jgi:ABC-2 type transport system ATP-binding protein
MVSRQPILQIEEVSKSFGDFRALKRVSLNVYPGEIFALLGPNGAGKTTLIVCITGLIQRFEGEIRVGGHEVREAYPLVRQLVGLVPQELNFDGFFKSRHVLEYQGGFFGRRDYRERARELLKAFALEEKAEANSRWLSGGMKRRLMICKALMHRPPILFLDEPTAGVDVSLREELWAYVRELRAAGTTIILTTHYLEEAEELADRIGMINRGELVLLERKDDLLEQFGERWLEVAFDTEVDPASLVLPEGVHGRAVNSHTVRFAFSMDLSSVEGSGSVSARLLRMLHERGLYPASIEGGRSSLEDIFRRVMEDAP